MNKKMIRNLIIIVSVLAVIAIGVLVGIPMVENYQAAQEQAEADRQAAETEENLAKRTLLDRKSSDVKTMQVIRAGDTLNFSRDPQLLTWVLDEHEELDLVQTVLDDLATNLAYAMGQQLVSEDGADLAEYGLDDPQMELSATFNDGDSVTYLVGDMAPDGKGYYVKRSDDPRIIRVSDAVGRSYIVTLERLHPIPTFNVDTTNIKSVQVWLGDEQILGMRDMESGNEATLLSWKIDYPYVTDVDGEKLTEYVESISAISIFETIDLSPENLADYGLDKPLRTLSYTTDDGSETTLYVGDPIEETGYSYVLVEGDPVVYSVLTSYFNFMDTPAFSLVSRLLALVNVANVSQFTVDALGQSVTVDVEQVPITEDDGSVRTDALGRVVNKQYYSIDGQDLTGDTGVTFYTQVITILVHSEVEEGYVPEGEPVGTISFKLNDRVTREESTVEFFEYQKDYYALRVDGDDVSFAVLKSTLEDIVDLIPKLLTGELDEGLPAAE